MHSTASTIVTDGGPVSTKVEDLASQDCPSSYFESLGRLAIDQKPMLKDQLEQVEGS